MKTALLFIATVVEEIQGSDLEDLTANGLHEDDIDEIIDGDDVHEPINAFLLMLANLGYRISTKEGQGVEYVIDTRGGQADERED